MMIIGNSVATAGATASSAQAASKTLGKNDFMKLLVSQLQHQNPLEPMNGADFTAQLAQFSSVEQMFNINDNLQQIQESNLQLRGSQAVNLIGKQIEAPGNAVSLGNAGSAVLTFELAGNAKETTIRIYNDAGDLVTTLSRENLTAGSQELVWNGTNAAGGKAPAGNYTFQVTASDENGGTVGSLSFTLGTIDGIVYDGNTAFATIGGKTFPVDSIAKIRQAK